MEFPPFEHLHWLAHAWRDGPPRHNLGSSAFAAPWEGRIDVTLTPNDLAGLDLNLDTPLAKALAHRWSLAEERVFVTAGTSGANLSALLAFVRPGCNVVSERPYYAPLPHLARGLGAEVRFVDRDPDADWRLDPQAVADAVDDHTALVLLTSPNNPTGAAASAADLRALGDTAAAVGARVLVDQVYRELTDHPVAARQHDACITTAGFNKCWGAAGLRTGWLAANAEDTRRIMEVHRLTVMANPVVGSRVGHHVLDHEAEARRLLEQRLAQTHAVHRAWCERTGRTVGPIGLTAFPTMPDLHEAALAAGILVVPGASFGRPGHVRIGLGIEPHALEAGLAALDQLDTTMRAQTF